MIRFGSRTFDVRPQQRIIRKRGTCVLWSRVARCTCSGDSGRANPSCEACHGSGYLVLSSKVIKGIVTSAMSDRLLVQSGSVQTGDLLFSQYPQNRCDEVQPLDRLILLDYSGEPFDGEHVTRGAGDRDDLSYIVATVVDLIVADQETGVIEHYVKGIDYTIDKDDVVWIGPHRPAEGQTYFIKYDITAEFVALPTTGAVPSALLQRYEGTTNLGQRIILRRRQFVDEPNPVPAESGIIIGPGGG
jgi:hypothetical protein